MKTINFCFSICCLSLLACGAFAQTVKITPVQSNAAQADGKPVKLPELRLELLKRLKASREQRIELVKNNSSAGVSQLVKSDQENTESVKSAVEKYGWLGNSLVGEDGQEAAFKLVMNAILDREFQKKYFELFSRRSKKAKRQPRKFRF
jgi:hypothetical protein